MPITYIKVINKNIINLKNSILNGIDFTSTIITGSIDNTIKFWSLDGKLLNDIKLQGMVISVDVCEKLKYMAIGLSTGEVIL